ncbi:Bifunctional protein PyrR [Anaerohalosphaera lusitana]|uniref:Bifunctional protein PyrR n=1 Tax=Anaerohalosphaera lusitana TaxID=1936003 RepID=A0A1U9NQN3_9BACT|nr:bifunctional pyr operon transcriptional regulator/uracil phosphoribosyltransferase PyrR [Anaerohalosphaera lusitana]AQT70242.1 Bifunctional protein PyrR [Anaerohalosphaera lusitana]
MEIILDAKQIQDALKELASQIASSGADPNEIVVVGIRSRGEILAQRLNAILSDMLSHEIPCGTLDITLYRDDFNQPRDNGYPTVQSTEIPFDINSRIVILVDDVIHTGRSARAALDALIDLGRPKVVRLAVLIDRGQRELPIQADYLGHKLDVPANKAVEVSLAEIDENEQVVVR